MNHTPVKLWRRQKAFSKMLGKTGTVLLSTVIRIPPVGFSESAPYPVVIVELENGKKTIGQLVDFPIEKSSRENLVGKKVVAVLRRIHSYDKEGIIPYTMKFKLL